MVRSTSHPCGVLVQLLYDRFWVLALFLKTLVESVAHHRFLYLVVRHYVSYNGSLSNDYGW